MLHEMSIICRAVEAVIKLSPGQREVERELFAPLRFPTLELLKSRREPGRRALMREELNYLFRASRFREPP